MTAWIFVLAGGPLVAGGVIALVALAFHPDNENDRDAAAQLARVAPAVEHFLDLEGEHLERLATVIAGDPKFFAVLNLPRTDRGRSDFRNALENVMREFQRNADTPLFQVLDERGALLGRALKPATEIADLSEAAFVRSALIGRPGQGYLVEKGNVYRVATVPVTAGGPILGVLCLGRSLDSDLAERLKSGMACEVAFSVSDEIHSSTIPPSPLRKVLAQRVTERSLAGAAKGRPLPMGRISPEDVDVINAGGGRFVVLRGTVRGPSIGGELAYVLVRPLDMAASPLTAIRNELLYAAGIGLLLAILGASVIVVWVRSDRRRDDQAHAAELERLRGIDRMRAGFIATASEEVVDPATSIRTVIGMIEEGALGELSGPQLEGILSIRNAAEELSRLGSDLANLTLLDRHELSLAFHECDVGDLVERAATDVLPMASERRQSLTVSVEPGLIHPRIDAEHLTKAISNIALHAVRLAPDGGRVEVGARRIERGIGVYVADAQAPPAAGPPTSSPAGDAQRGGLAMAVATGIVEAHGGAIRVWNEPGAGNRFVVDLPFPVGVALEAEDGVGPNDKPVGQAA
jgi:signal transduction histidine kinase